QRAVIAHFGTQFVVLICLLCIVNAKLYAASWKQRVNKSIVRADRNPLIKIVKIVIIVGISHRKALNDKRRKIFTVSAPLFFRVSFDEFYINIQIGRAHV